MGRESKLLRIQEESIQKQIAKATNMASYCRSRLNALDDQMTRDQAQFDAIKNRYNHLAKRMQEETSNQESYIVLLKNKILDLDKKPIKQPNGKIICQYCEKEFSPQGIASHERACKIKFDERARLKAELEKLEKEELIPVEMPEVKKLTAEQMIITDPTIVNPEPTPMPTTEEKLELVKEVKQIVNTKKAELEAELEQKEGE